VELDRLEPPATHNARAILRELARALRRVAEGRSGEALLDFGAGGSPYRSLFRGYDRYVTADLPGEGADLTIDRGHVPADSGSFDAVLSTQVLEHVSDPDAYLTEAHRLLGPGGTLILSTHGLYPYHPFPEDLWRWTGPGLRRQIERQGFAVTELIPVVSAPAAALNMLAQYATEAIPSRLQAAWHFVSQWLVRALDRLSPRRDPSGNLAAVFVVVAQRLEPDPSDVRTPGDQGS
jgi:SAM-dependent methyltransferase